MTFKSAVIYRCREFELAGGRGLRREHTSHPTEKTAGCPWSCLPGTWQADTAQTVLGFPTSDLHSVLRPSIILGFVCVRYIVTFVWVKIQENIR